MEWTQTNPVGATPFEAHKVAHHIDNVGSVKNHLYCIVVNHLVIIILFGFYATYGIRYQGLVNGGDAMEP